MVDQKGITLVETLVVLAIVSIISAISYPPLREWYSGACFRSEVSQLVSWLHRAKTEAGKAGSYVVVKIKTDGYSIFVDNSEIPRKSGDWIRQPDERQLVEYKLKNGLTIDNTFTGDRLRFGMKAGMKAGSFILRDSVGHSMKVVISIIGRIRVE
jgi:prepilin-type N-terminal cleavage/methylation domain-containing protein